ncbi:MAG TPA: class I SAM-dependent methyltransferase [Terracidiphilus sp.]
MTFRKILEGLQSPTRTLKYFKRVARNNRLWSSRNNFLDFYSRVVDDYATHVSPELAVGSDSHEHWLSVGRFQFDFLVAHGLRREHRFLDIGCGNLRLGACLIPYLNELGYTGIDISPRIVTAALDTIKTYNLQNKLPRIFLVSETNYEFFPENYFDVVNAHSVFSHLPTEEIEKVLREAYRVLKPGGWFDFTYKPGTEISDYLKEDFFFPEKFLLELAAKCGYQPLSLKDWVYSQDKIRAVKPA